MNERKRHGLLKHDLDNEAAKKKIDDLRKKQIADEAKRRADAHLPASVKASIAAAKAAEEKKAAEAKEKKETPPVWAATVAKENTDIDLAKQEVERFHQLQRQQVKIKVSEARANPNDNPREARRQRLHHSHMFPAPADTAEKISARDSRITKREKTPHGKKRHG
jgi:hypothetical protein